MVLERDVTHRHITADFSYTFNPVSSVVDHDFLTDQVGRIL